MKLRTKLLINFTFLFFILFNFFGVILIKIFFYTILHNTIENSFSDYKIIYSTLQDGERMSLDFFDIQDIMSLKINTYLSNSSSDKINVEVENLDREIMFSSYDYANKFDDSVYQLSNNSNSNYIITRYQGRHYLYINKIISFYNQEYYLIYSKDIEDFYQEKNHYIFLLIIFNVIGGLFSTSVIYLFTKKITHPLQNLIDNMDNIIKENNYTQLKETSDITELSILSNNFNIMSNKIYEQMGSLEEANENKQRFIDSLAHEIRTPLTSIIGYSSLCLNYKSIDTVTYKEAFENIYSNGKRIENLTEALIKLITLDKTALQLQSLDLFVLMNDIKTTFQRQISEFDIDFTILGDSLFIVSDRELLMILFSNLIDNAIKAVDHTENKKVEIQLIKNTVIICDNGKGISKQDLEKIFEPFYMADKSRKKYYEGFGLGLAICNDIMNILNIQFKIQSELNKGTEIILTFIGDEKNE